jgi:hypothetical protein
MKKIIFSLLLLLAMLAGSCKKDKLLTLEQKILGKWNWVSNEVFHTPADPADNDYFFPAGAYWEFKADGTIMIFNGNQGSAVNWHKVNDNSFYTSPLGPNNPYTISVASAKQLVIQWQVMDNGIPKINRETFSKP